MKLLEKYFLDTYKKRVTTYYSILVVVLLVTIISEIRMGYALTSVHSTEALYSLLDQSFIYSSVTGRLIASFLNYAYTNHGVWNVMIHAFTISNVVFVLFVFLFPSVKDKEYRYFSIHVMVLFSVECLLWAIFLISVASCFNAGTLADALTRANLVCVVYSMVQAVFLLANFCWFAMNLFRAFFDEAPPQPVVPEQE